MGNVDHLDASCFSSGQTPDGKMRGESVCVYFDVDNKLFFTKKKKPDFGLPCGLVGCSTKHPNAEGDRMRK